MIIKKGEVRYILVKEEICYGSRFGTSIQMSCCSWTQERASMIISNSVGFFMQSGSLDIFLFLSTFLVLILLSP